MLWKAVTLLGLALCARGEHHATSEQKLKQEFVIHHSHHGDLNHIGSHLPEHHEEYAWAYPSYEFSYSVNDPHTHDHKGQHEKRHGDEVKGEYWLLQPDGKKRTVKYESDKHKGFKAEVHYSEHPHEHRHEEPKEEILKPVLEIVDEEPEKQIEEIEPILVEEVPEVVVEEPVEEHIEPKHHKPIHHKPIHIEYYINHKYRKHHHEEHHKPQEESREQERGEENGEEARVQEKAEPRKEIKHRKPVHIEYYTKIHHDVHHEIPTHHHVHIEKRKDVVRHSPIQFDDIRGKRKQDPRVQLRRMQKPLPYASS